MSFELMMDIVVVLLLVPTIIYAIILNSRLSALRRNRDELAKVVAAFNEATLRAEAGVPRLKQATADAAKTLQERVEKAQTLRDDLAFMVDRAEETAGRLEHTVNNARTVAASQPAAVQQPVAAQSAAAVMGGASSARAVMAEEVPPQPMKQAAGTLADRSAAMDVTDEDELDLQNLLNAARQQANVTGQPPRAGEDVGAVGGKAAGRRAAMDVDERSEAERALLRALQSAR